MTINEGSIALLASQSMDDESNGGGAASGIEIVDGASNAIFPDISARDRITGKVRLRKIFVAIRTALTEGYYGAMAYISRPPSDPNVSVTMFDTRSHFDTRADAVSRMEAYLAPGPAWGGYLFENHIQGQRNITLLQRVGSDLPTVGGVLVLVADEGTAAEFMQFVRVTRVTYTRREFENEDLTSGTYERWIVSCEISERLSRDFRGSSAIRKDANQNAGGAGKTIVRSSVVADSASYAGISPLSVAATTGALSVSVGSIFSQLVPSSQTDIPVVDATPALSISALMASSQAPVVITTSAPLSASAGLFLGASCYPGSLKIDTNGETINDANGVLYVGTEEVGVIDYDNGVLSVPAGGRSFTAAKRIEFKQAASPTVVTDSASIAVTTETRSLSCALTLDPVPAPGSLTVAYRALGKWYVLRDQGSGDIKGGDVSHGAGRLSFVSGGLACTFGALPDVGSQIVLSWGTTSQSAAMPAVSTAGGFTLALGNSVPAGTVTLSWLQGEATKTATASGNTLSGDATGTINRSSGDIEFCPASLIPDGTQVTVTFPAAEMVSSAPSFMTLTDSGATWTGTAGMAVAPGTFGGDIEIRARSATMNAPPGVSASFDSYDISARRAIRDDGAGKIGVTSTASDGTASFAACGTIDYASGNVIIQKNFEAIGFVVSELKQNVTLAGALVISGWSAGLAINTPSACYATGAGGVGSLKFSGSAGTNSETLTVAASGWHVKFPRGLGARWVPGSVRIEFGGKVLLDRAGRLLADIDPATGAGADVGAIDYISGIFTPSSLLGASSPIARRVAALEQSGAMTVTGCTFRTPVAPIRSGSLGLAATLSGPAARVITGTFGIGGYLITDDMVGVCDAETGTARVWYRAAGAPESAQTLDLSAWKIPGVTKICPALVLAETQRFACVGYAYVPLDAEVIGVAPTRLPQDGRVPIFQAGGVAIVHHTATTSPATVSNGQTIDVGRTRLAKLRVIGADGQRIAEGFTRDLDAGTVSFTEVSGYSQPVRVEHRISDAMLIREAQISGQISLSQRLTHDFPLGSYVSSAILLQPDPLQARVTEMFDQATWSSRWQDTVDGSGCNATYNVIQSPIRLRNDSTITERWLIRFTNTTTFDLIGEHLGQIASGNTATDFAPVNPTTGQPYFTLSAAGWGSGWSAGNCLRINTEGAMPPLWLARTVQQGPATVDDDWTQIDIDGDIDRE